MTADPILIADEIDLTLKSKAGPVDILRSVSLSVSRGESVGIVGRSGSGKSSLLSVLAGLERPNAGRIRAAGQDLLALSEDDLARFRLQHVGFVFQAFHLIPTMTALENAALPLEFARRKDAFDQARAMLAAAGLGARLDHYPDQLSGGEQQRVAIVRALVGRPSILLADEPTGNLDAASSATVIDMLFDLQRVAGSALVLVSHDHVLAGRCDRIVSMEDGRLFDGARMLAAQ